MTNTKKTVNKGKAKSQKIQQDPNTNSIVVKPCSKCDKKFENDKSNVTCEVCKRDFHRDCFGLPSSVIDRLTKASYLICCESCNIGCRNFFAKVAKNEERIDQMEMGLTGIRSDVESIQQHVSDLEERLAMVEQVRAEPSASYAQVPLIESFEI